MKNCTKCKKQKKLAEFREYKMGMHRSECRRCEVKQAQLKLKAHKEAGEKPDMCECCKKPTKNLVVDHCHSSGKFRGWLCRNCNAGIGKLGDTDEGIIRALNYLQDDSFKDGEGI